MQLIRCVIQKNAGERRSGAFRFVSFMRINNLREEKRRRRFHPALLFWARPLPSSLTFSPFKERLAHFSSFFWARRGTPLLCACVRARCQRGVFVYLRPCACVVWLRANLEPLTFQQQSNNNNKKKLMASLKRARGDVLGGKKRFESKKK